VCVCDHKLSYLSYMLRGILLTLRLPDSILVETIVIVGRLRVKHTSRKTLSLKSFNVQNVQYKVTIYSSQEKRKDSHNLLSRSLSLLFSASSALNIVGVEF
jgi:hypothetical protein